MGRMRTVKRPTSVFFSFLLALTRTHTHKSPTRSHTLTHTAMPLYIPPFVLLTVLPFLVWATPPSCVCFFCSLLLLRQRCCRVFPFLLEPRVLLTVFFCIHFETYSSEVSAPSQFTTSVTLGTCQPYSGVCSNYTNGSMIWVPADRTVSDMEEVSSLCRFFPSFSTWVCVRVA